MHVLHHSIPEPSSHEIIQVIIVLMIQRYVWIPPEFYETLSLSSLYTWRVWKCEPFKKFPLLSIRISLFSVSWNQSRMWPWILVRTADLISKSSFLIGMKEHNSPGWIW